MIHIGTSGWNYPTGRGTWNGIFYPRARPRGFDELAYYAGHFDTVEVNSTFYRVPEPGQTRRWIERTPASFLFSVKLYQKFTHPDMYLSRDGVTGWDLSRADVDQFRLGVEPLAAAGRLAALLIQFPPSFHAEPDTRDYLDWLLEAFRGHQTVVELRHRSWSDEAETTRKTLAAHSASWALIDAPKTPGVVSDFTAEGVMDVRNDSRSLLYLRLHGRNAERWWDHEAAEDRYDYLYSPAELAPIAETAKRAAAGGRRVLLYLNNHFSAKAVANASVLQHQLGQPVPGEYPPEMVERYPDLAGIVVTSPTLL